MKNLTPQPTNLCHFNTDVHQIPLVGRNTNGAYNRFPPNRLIVAPSTQTFNSMSPTFNNRFSPLQTLTAFMSI